MPSKNEKIYCPISGTEMSLWMSIPIDYRTGKTIDYGNIYRSNSSEYAQVIPVPTAENIISFYELNEYYTHDLDLNLDKNGNKTSFLDQIRVKIAKAFNFPSISILEIINSLGTSKDIDICEIGCGSGDLLMKLKESGYKVFGVEPDPKAKVFTKNLNVEQGTSENLPETIKNKKFDIIIMSHVLEHCQNPLQAVENIYDLLEINGYFICEVPNNECLGLDWSGPCWFWLDVPRHLHFFTTKSLHGICQKAGFSVINTYYKGYLRQFSNFWIDEEAKIYDILIKSEQKIVPLPIRNSKLRAWKLLLATLFAPPERKSDAVLVVCKKTNK